MKKNKGILVGLILLVCLISCFIVIRKILIGNEISKNNCEYFGFEDIIVEINSATNHSFLSGRDLTSYIPVSLTKDIKYTFAVNAENEQEYFIIIKDISEKDLKEFKNTLGLINIGEKDLEIKQVGNYTYIISSNQNYSTIDGIIRSFSTCYLKE